MYASEEHILTMPSVCSPSPLATIGALVLRFTAMHARGRHSDGTKPRPPRAGGVDRSLELSPVVRESRKTVLRLMSISGCARSIGGPGARINGTGGGLVVGLA